MKKEFDAIKMIRHIRDKSSQNYFANKEKWLKELSKVQGKDIKSLNSKTKTSKSAY